VLNTKLFLVDDAQERQTQNISGQNIRIASVEETCNRFEAQSRDLEQVRAKCSELDAIIRDLTQNVPRGETGLPG